MREMGETLATLRKEKGLGQKQLAALLNMSVGTVSNYENNVHSPTWPLCAGWRNSSMSPRTICWAARDIAARRKS